MTGGRTAPRPGAAAAGLLVVLLVAHLAEGVLVTPALTDFGEWPVWLDGRDPVVIALSILRLTIQGLAWYLLGVLVVGTVLRFRGATYLVTVFDRITPAALRRVMAGVVVLGLAGPATAQTDVNQTATATTTTTALAELRNEPVTMHRLLDGENPSSSTVASPTVTAPSTPPPVPTTQAPGPPAADSWTVRPGECFWTIAEEVLAGAWGRPPSDAEVVPYWRRLIEANRHLLADPANPDLIFPGQVFAVPAP